MEKLILSNEENRIIHFGISEVERYITGEKIDDDPWWNIFLYIKKPGIEINHFGETMTKWELMELSQTIKNCKNRDWSIEECVSFMEPDYRFDIVRELCYLNINLWNQDSLRIKLTKENMNDITDYIDRNIH